MQVCQDYVSRLASLHGWLASNLASSLSAVTKYKRSAHPRRESDRDAPLVLVSTEGAAGSGPRLRDQIAVEEKEVPLPVADVDVSRELTPAEREALDKELEELAPKMDSLWKGRADRSEWDEVKADLEVYRLSGETVLEDPRRQETYRQAVLEGLGFGDDAAERRPGMSSDDLAACKRS